MLRGSNVMALMWKMLRNYWKIMRKEREITGKCKAHTRFCINLNKSIKPKELICKRL